MEAKKGFVAGLEQSASKRSKKNPDELKSVRVTKKSKVKNKPVEIQKKGKTM